MTNRAATLQQLIEMRGRLLDDLGERIDGGSLSLLTAIGGALAAIDAELGMDPEEVQPATRIVLTDDGDTARLTLYGNTGAVAAVPLSPLRLVGLAGELIAAAMRRL